MSVQQNLTIRLLRVLRYNKARCERAIALLPDDKKPLFQVLPFLLHINHPLFPGYIESDVVPFGLNNYSLRDLLKEALVKVFPQHSAMFDDMRQLWPKRKCIDSLMLMGSLGSVAQTDSSDLDYWVCIDGQSYSQQQLVLLQKKLDAIETWAQQHYQLEVHFFLSEIDKIKNNDFGVADGESSGSAGAISLKAEFYTSHIVVAGKAPFWWLMSADTSDQEYAQQLALLRANDTPDPKWFVDLGNLHKMDSGEIFGAAIWQLSKAMDSPFKSVLKMAKLEVFLQNIEQRQALCNQLKQKVHSGEHAPGELEQVDPYALMFDELILYYQQQDNQQAVQLLQLCFYLKCGCKLSYPAEKGQNNFKRQIIASYVRQWGWSKQKIMRIDRIKHWQFPQLSSLSKKIHSFLIMCYRRISQNIETQEQILDMQDMTVIGRRIDAFYSKKQFKIDYLRSAFDDELYCDQVTIKVELDKSLRRIWSMYIGNLVHKDQQAEHICLKSSANPVELVVWGVTNRILDKDSQILLGYKTEPVTEPDLQHLARYLEQLFPVKRIADIKRHDLLAAPRIINCLAVANMDQRQLKGDIASLSVIYSDSWGEVYLRTGFDSLLAIRDEYFDPEDPPGCFLLLPEGSHKKRLIEDFSEQSGMLFEVLK